MPARFASFRFCVYLTKTKHQVTFGENKTKHFLSQLKLQTFEFLSPGLQRLWLFGLMTRLLQLQSWLWNRHQAPYWSMRRPSSVNTTTVRWRMNPLWFECEMFPRGWASHIFGESMGSLEVGSSWWHRLPQVGRAHFWLFFFSLSISWSLELGGPAIPFHHHCLSPLFILSWVD